MSSWLKVAGVERSEPGALCRSQRDTANQGRKKKHTLRGHVELPKAIKNKARLVTSPYF